MGSSFDIYDDRKTVVKPLKLIASIWERELRLSPADEGVIQLGHNLVPVLDSNIGPDGISVISNPYPESNILTGPDRIWMHIKIFNEQRTNAMGGHGPSLMGPSGAKLLRQVHRPSRPFDIYLYRETILISFQSVVRLRESNPIISRPQYNIINSSYHFIFIFNIKVDPPRMSGKVRDDRLKTHPLTLSHGIRAHLQLKDPQITGLDRGPRKSFKTLIRL
jgi:hypothetical protein